MVPQVWDAQAFQQPAPFDNAEAMSPRLAVLAKRIPLSVETQVVWAVDRLEAPIGGTAKCAPRSTAHPAPPSNTAW